MSDLFDKSKMLAECPTTGQMVEPIRQVDMSAGSQIVIWWQCPVCKGWHLQTPKEENSEEV